MKKICLLILNTITIFYTGFYQNRKAKSPKALASLDLKEASSCV